MDENLRVLRDYLVFTVPHITVLAGALLGVLLVLGVDVNIALGIFAVFYGAMLLIIALIIRPHVSGSAWYRAILGFFVGLIFLGLFLLFYGE